jgi:hypothetical protein
MGGSHSVEIPGGGTEGYHVLTVRQPVKGKIIGKFMNSFVSTSYSSPFFTGAPRLARTEGWPRGLFRLYRLHWQYEIGTSFLLLYFC